MRRDDHDDRADHPHHRSTGRRARTTSGGGAAGAPPLLLIGSPMGAGGFVTLASHFPDRTVVTYDPRGVDRSAKADRDSQSTPDQHADDLHRVIADLGAGRSTSSPPVAARSMRWPSWRASRRCPHPGRSRAAARVVAARPRGRAGSHRASARDVHEERLWAGDGAVHPAVIHEGETADYTASRRLTRDVRPADRRRRLRGPTRCSTRTCSPARLRVRLRGPARGADADRDRRR